MTLVQHLPDRVSERIVRARSELGQPVSEIVSSSRELRSDAPALAEPRDRVARGLGETRRGARERKRSCCRIPARALQQADDRSPIPILRGLAECRAEPPGKL